jgi:hypothetical protein
MNAPPHVHDQASSEIPSNTNLPAHQHEPAPTNTPSAAHQHEGTSQPATKSRDHSEHLDARATQTNAPHAHETQTGLNYSVSSVLTDTPEALWSQLHRHQAELKSAIASKKLEEIHPQAEAIKQLTAAPVAVVHPDHKDSVQPGAHKVNQAISGAHKSAHADDLAGVESNFQQFNQVLDQLEQQMRKQ